jgi:hypothetical protein
MRALLRLIVFAAALLAPSGALAQSACPYIAFGAVLTAGQWNTCFAAKADANAVVSSITNVDGTLTISPSTGAITASLNLAHANTWAAPQTIDNGSGAVPAGGSGATWKAYGADGSVARIEITAFNNGVSGAAIFDGRTSLGTRASPLTVTSGTLLASFEGKGYDSSVWTGTGASLHVYADGTWSPTSHPGAACLATTASAAISITDHLCVRATGGVTLDSPTGGDLGAGKFNVPGGYYVNGVLASGVASVSNNDGTLTISPTTGAVVASLALGHANTWTGAQTFSTAATTFNSASIFNATATFADAGTWDSGGINGSNIGQTTPGLGQFTGVGINTSSPAAGIRINAAVPTVSNGLGVIGATTGKGLILAGQGTQDVTVQSHLFVDVCWVNATPAWSCPNLTISASVTGPDGSTWGTTGLGGLLGLGLGVAAPTNSRISQTLGANNVTAYLSKRNTDTSPTGNFLDFQSAAAASLFTVDITGKWTTGSIGAVTVALGSDATGDIYYRDSGGLLHRLPISSNGFTLQIASGLPAWNNAATALNNILPTPLRAGEIVYWNGSVWTTLAGNNSGTTLLQETGAGVPSWIATTGTGSAVLATSPALVTPALGVATGTSLALGGGSIGSDALEVTGTSTFNGSVTVAGAPFVLSGNQSVPAWTTNGVRIKGITGTLTDTTSSGTVAAAVTDTLGGNTIAASSAVTYTNYISLYVKAPIAGTNVTFTNSWALGGDSLRIGTSNPFTVSASGAVTVTGSFTATGLVTNADLVNPATTVNGQTCTLGATCTVAAAAGTLTGTTLASGVVTSSLTSVGTLTGGTAGTGFVIAGVTMTLGSDANYDIYYRDSTGVIKRLAADTAGKVLSTNSTSAPPSWVAAGGTGTVTSVVCASTTITTTGTCYNRGQLVATNTNDDATAGNFGEVQDSSAVTATSLTTGTPLTCTSKSLPAGNWMVNGTIGFNPSGAATITDLSAAISQTTNALVGAGLTSQTDLAAGGGTASKNPNVQVGPTVIKLASTTTIYLVGQANFAVGTVNFNSCELTAYRFR